LDGRDFQGKFLININDYMTEMGWEMWNLSNLQMVLNHILNTTVRYKVKEVTSTEITIKNPLKQRVKQNDMH
jgi:hypothetical protein